ncbi:MAG: ATP/GTP-binding protein [Dehalococcoidia bacterium]
MLLDSFSIKGFRGIPQLVIPRLGRATLLIGKNGVGKTTVLEALRVYASRGGPATLTEILAGHDEYVLPRGRPQDPDRRTVAFESLFNGRPTLSQAATIELGPFRAASRTLRLSRVWYREIFDEERGFTRRVIQDPRDDEILEKALQIRFGRSSYLRPLDSPRAPSPRIPGFENIGAVFVGATGIEKERVATLWDAVALTELEDEIINALRMILPNLERISLVEDAPRSRSAMAKIQGSSTPVPLRSLGDGMNRLLSIALSLVNSQDGILLIDEFENGIFYETQSELWDFVLKVATRLNIQIVATTHSEDCIRAFIAVATQSPEKGYVVRLEKSNEGTIRAVEYDEDELSVVSAQRLEIR